MKVVRYYRQNNQKKFTRQNNCLILTVSEYLQKKSKNVKDVKNFLTYTRIIYLNRVYSEIQQTTVEQFCISSSFTSWRKSKATIFTSKTKLFYLLLSELGMIFSRPNTNFVTFHQLVFVKRTEMFYWQKCQKVNSSFS